MNYSDTIIDLIGDTPLIKLNKISNETNSLVLGKCEFLNPTSSVKDRIGFSMVEDAIKKGVINQSTTIIEPTSGNTGIALASICATKNIRLILTMPESMSIERRKLLKFLGAEIELTPKEKGMAGAVERAKELNREIENSIILDQFSNPSNPSIHEITTAEEILRDTEGKIDYFVAGVGTGGTLTGVGRVLKKRVPNIKIVAVEPKESAILSGEKPFSHKIQGIGAGFIPKILDTSIYDEVFKVSSKEAFDNSRELAKEGLLVGISSGANVFVSKMIAKEKPNRVIVTILADTAERYLSTELFD